MGSLTTVPSFLVKDQLKPSVTLPPTGVYSGSFASLYLFLNCCYWCCWTHTTPQGASFNWGSWCSVFIPINPTQCFSHIFAWQHPQFPMWDHTPHSTVNWSQGVCHHIFLATFPASWGRSQSENHNHRINFIRGCGSSSTCTITCAPMATHKPKALKSLK